MEKIQTQVRIILRLMLTLTLLGFTTLSCQSNNSRPGGSNSAITPQNTVTKGVDEISVMGMNVENMFDSVHDKDTEDFTYLPLAQKNSAEVQSFCAKQKSYYQDECYDKDWNTDIVKFKLSQVAKTIRYVDSGKGPDIILMAEVENINVLNQLADTELKDSGYQTRVLIEGPDVRGIDPAILSKFPLSGKPKLHIIPYVESDPDKAKYAKRSRGIIEATFTLPNKKEITILAAHFPSQANPSAWRVQAVDFMKNKMLEYEKQGRAVIAGGDLNITDHEENEYGFFKKELSQAGAVSHLVGCKSCEGTEIYRGHWSFLDVLVFSHGLSNAGLTLIPESIAVVKAPHHTKPNGTALRFDADKREGVSDHFPLYSRLKIKN